MEIKSSKGKKITQKLSFNLFWKYKKPVQILMSDRQCFLKCIWDIFPPGKSIFL